MERTDEASAITKEACLRMLRNLCLAAHVARNNAVVEQPGSDDIALSWSEVTASLSTHRNQAALEEEFGEVSYSFCPNVSKVFDKFLQDFEGFLLQNRAFVLLPLQFLELLRLVLTTRVEKLSFLSATVQEWRGTIIVSSFAIRTRLSQTCKSM